MNKMLLIVDPQVDFISGSLPVSGASERMDSLAEYIDDFGKEYSHILVTLDFHPARHCSFKDYGGEWPVHCVRHSVGAAIWPSLMNALMHQSSKVVILTKGTDEASDQYSIFRNTRAGKQIIHMVSEEKISRIDICGIAGDVCVASTIEDGITLLGTELFKVLTRYTASIDDGSVMNSLIDKYQLSCDR